MSQLLSCQKSSGYLLTHKVPVSVLVDMDTVFPLCPRCLFLCPSQILCFTYASVWSMELIPLKTNFPLSLPSCTFCFFWHSGGSHHCAITQRVVPASRGWEARKGLLLLVAVAAAAVGLTATLESHTNHSSRAGEKPSPIVHSCWGTSSSRQTPIEFCTTEKTVSHKPFRVRSVLKWTDRKHFTWQHLTSL